MAKLASKTYGEALFSLAAEENKLDLLYEEAETFLAAYSGNEELKKFLLHPEITREEKIQTLENMFKGRLDDSIVGFLIIIVEKSHCREIESIFSYFLMKVMEYKKIGVVYVTSAVELTREQKAKVEQRLLQVTQYVELKLNFKVEEALIGGMIIRIGDRVVDSSIRTQLENMKKELLKVQLS